MLNINPARNKYFLRNSPAIPFFYNKFSIFVRKIDNLIHLITVGRMATGVLHDMMNPLTSLLLSLDIKDAPIKEIQKNSKELSEFIRVIQTQLKNNPVKEEFLISEIIKDCCLLLKYKSIIGGVRIINIFSQDFKVYGNKIALMRVILNLINNAIESYENITREKNDVVVSLYKKKKHIHISIKDFGCGMTNKQKSKAFKYFYTNKFNGTGIGLYTSNISIKREYSGYIKLESSLGKGSVFTIKIPLKTSL